MLTSEQNRRLLEWVSLEHDRDPGRLFRRLITWNVVNRDDEGIFRHLTWAEQLGVEGVSKEDVEDAVAVVLEKERSKK